MGPAILIAAGVSAIVLAVRSALSSSGDSEASMVSGDIPWSLTLAEFQACLPSLPVGRAVQLFDPFLDACHEAGITSKAQLATFIAQLGHESVDFRYFTEFADGTAYEGREDLGNSEAGDGPRFRGRGAIMLTGRANYRAAGDALGVDLELNPELAATDVLAFRVAAWFWRRQDLNDLADQRQFVAMTRVINGGVNGLADRQTRLALACRVLGIDTAWS